MKPLNIFFPTKQLRDDYIKEVFALTEIVYNGNTLGILIEGITEICFRSKYKKNPGYWVQIKFDHTQESKRLMDKIQKLIPKFWLGHNVFFPKKVTNMNQMEKMWIQKYHLMNEMYNSNVWKIFLKEARLHLEEERIDVACIALFCIYKKNPFFLKKYKRYYLFEDLAYYYEARRELDKSIKCLKAQASLQPNSTEPYLNMSNFLLLHGLNEEAIDVCRQGLKIDLDDQYLRNNLLVAYMNGQHFDLALTHLQNLVVEDADVSMYWKLMGDIFFQTDKNYLAIACYKKALDIYSKDIYDLIEDIYYGLGICYEQVNQFEKAVGYFKKVLKYDDTDMEVLFHLSKIYRCELKQYDEAENYAKKIIKYYPESGYGYHNMGLIYLYTGRLEQAKWYLYRARKLIPEYKPVHDAIVELKVEKRKYPAL
ncbi:tetratricopeptide repeat protein [Clostridiaceae bacterium 35-E11]